MMDSAGYRRIEARHPNWYGHLLLSATDDTVVHERVGSRGRYELLGDEQLTVTWDLYGQDVFTNIGGLFVHRLLAATVPELRAISIARIGQSVFRIAKVSIRVPNSNHDVSLRVGTSDAFSFEQVFHRNDYECPELPASAHTIVDLGANIGLATVFFGLRYPTARILSVEPDPANFAAMVDNTAALGERVRAVCGAVWTKDGTIGLHTHDETGALLGEWATQVSDKSDRRTAGTVPCYGMSTLLDGAGFATIDILKIDIEGAELELFADGHEAWLPRIMFIIVETHDRFRPGSEAAVRKALHPWFEDVGMAGDNLVFRRFPGVDIGNRPSGPIVIGSDSDSTSPESRLTGTWS